MSNCHLLFKKFLENAPTKTKVLEVYRKMLSSERFGIFVETFSKDFFKKWQALAQAGPFETEKLRKYSLVEKASYLARLNIR